MWRIFQSRHGQETRKPINPNVEAGNKIHISTRTREKEAPECGRRALAGDVSSSVTR
jgi:hypothetical protein